VAAVAQAPVVQPRRSAPIGFSFDRPWRPGEPRGTRLVVIGEKGLDREAAAAAFGGG